MDQPPRSYLVELLGTFGFVFVAGAAVCVNALAAIDRTASGDRAAGSVIVQPEPGLAGIALAAGAAYACCLAATLSVSGGFLNPAIVLTLWVFKRLDSARTFLLVACQLVGATLAGAALRLLFSFRLGVLAAAELGTPHVAARMFEGGRLAGHAVITGIGIELVLTFVLTFVLYATVVDPRAHDRRGWGSPRWCCVWAGLAVFAGTLVAFPVTGAALNPARWFGPVVWEFTVPLLAGREPLRDHYVYWFGPITGALLAALAYNLFISAAEPEAVLPADRKLPAARL